MINLRNLGSFLFTLSLLSGYSHHAFSQEPSLNTEVKASCYESKPHAFIENKTIRGTYYNIAKNVFDHAGVSLRYSILPWSRVYYYGTTKSNYLIGCIGRTSTRENMFHWIGPVSKGENVFFFKIKSSPHHISTIEDAKNFIIGVGKRSFSFDFLKENGFSNENIHPVTKLDHLIKMLEHSRFDFIITKETTLINETNNLNIDYSLFEKSLHAFTIKEYMAFSKNTSPDLVAKTRAAYQELIEDGTIPNHLNSTE